MTYFPKSQIKENLFTSGGEFEVKSTKKEYKGYYWATSAGTFFTGKTPEQKPTTEIIRIEEGDELFDLPQNETFWTEIYNNTITSTKPGSVPTFYKLTPTQSDYDKQYVTRYFTRKTNQNIYFEITKSDYDLIKSKSTKIQWQLYESFSLQWQLIGEEKQVYNTNRNSVLELEAKQRLPGFSKIFKKNYLQFYKKT